ncbi:MAG: 2Fe-2S iron-sulfur cluster binding domain-containing protein [Bacillaceae bacterium]|nr:2Fe-2S iron-sulfur cluster binding domain-containing protein [Bacillaceae bacterium]
MAKLTFLPVQKKVQIREGMTILEGAKRGRVGLRHKCGGKGSCTTCKVMIGADQPVTKPRPLEMKVLGESLIRKGWRLSCQTRIFGNTTVEIPDDPARSYVQSRLNLTDRERESDV